METESGLMTVRGWMQAPEAGFTLPHEHVMSMFGKEAARYPWYERSRVEAEVIPYLQEAVAAGIRTVLDCTTASFGRHPELLLEVSERTGLAIVANTGYYGAAQDRYVPAHARRESADDLADRWITEWRRGIDGTDVRPGFIKTAVDPGPLSEIDRKLVVAALRTHRQTGLTVQTHLGDNPEAAEQILGLLREERVHPSAWVWVHAHNVRNRALLAQAARAGAWISCDGLRTGKAEGYAAIAAELKREGLLGRLLLSHDGDVYTAGAAARLWHPVTEELCPLLVRQGISEDQVRGLTTVNPAEAFSVRVRLVE